MGRRLPLSSAQLLSFPDFRASCQAPYPEIKCNVYQNIQMDAASKASVAAHHPGVELRANLKSISPRCHPFEVAFVWDLTKETIHLPLGCLPGGWLSQRPTAPERIHIPYRGTSLIRNSPLLGPYGRTMPRALRRS